jgi:hypothetical protein
MDLLILKREPVTSTVRYQGTDKIPPHYVDGLPEEAEVNRLFLWYCEEGGESGLVHNLSAARQLVQAYHGLKPPEFFDILEVSIDPAHKSDGRFLGYDLSAGYVYSLLSWGLVLQRETGQPGESDGNGSHFAIQPLLRLVEEHFGKKLNSYGLFDEHEDARFCLNTMMALQSIVPGLWENEEVTFDVVGLWRIEA